MPRGLKFVVYKYINLHGCQASCLKFAQEVKYPIVSLIRKGLLFHDQSGKIQILGYLQMTPVLIVSGVLFSLSPIFSKKNLGLQVPNYLN